MCKAPSMDQWLLEAKQHPGAPLVGMYLTHNGVVRRTSRAQARQNCADAPVQGMQFSYDREKLEEALSAARQMQGIHYVRAWLNEGLLNVGDDLMFLIVGGDIRPHAVAALEFLLDRIKGECVQEREVFDLPPA